MSIDFDPERQIKPQEEGDTSREWDKLDKKPPYPEQPTQELGTYSIPKQEKKDGWSFRKKVVALGLAAATLVGIGATTYMEAGNRANAEHQLSDDTSDSAGENPEDYGGGEEPESPLKESVTLENFPFVIDGTPYTGIDGLKKKYGVPDKLYDKDTSSDDFEAIEKPIDRMIEALNALNNFEFTEEQLEALEEYKTDNFDEENVFRTIIDAWKHVLVKNPEVESEWWTYIEQNALQSFRDRHDPTFPVDNYKPYYTREDNASYIPDKGTVQPDGSMEIPYFELHVTYVKNFDRNDELRNELGYINELKFWGGRAGNTSGLYMFDMSALKDPA